MAGLNESAKSTRFSRLSQRAFSFDWLLRLDAIIAFAVAAKSIGDERQRRVNWKRIEQSAALFVADERA